MPRASLFGPDLREYREAWRHRHDEVRVVLAPAGAEVVLPGSDVVESQNGIVGQRPFSVARELHDAPAVLAEDVDSIRKHPLHEAKPCSSRGADLRLNDCEPVTSGHGVERDP